MTNAASTPPTPPEKKPSGAAGCLALVLAFLLVLTTPLALLAFDVYRVVFNPPLVKRILADEVVNHELLPVALEWFSDRRAQERVEKGEALVGVDEPDVVLLMSFMDRQDWKDVKNEVLTEEILTEWVSVTVDGAYAWIDSDDRVPQITWSMKSFKDRVNTEHGVNAIVVAYDNLPPCTQAEIDDFLHRQSLAPGVEVLYNLCEFPDPWREDQFNDYVDALKKVAANIPDEFALTDELAKAPDTAGAGPTAIKQQLRLIRLLGSLAWVVPAALLLLVAAMRVRTLDDLSRWVGAPLLVGGFLTLLPAIIYRWLLTSGLGAAPLSEVPEVVVEEATRAILRLAAAIFQPMLIQSVVVMLAGIALLVWRGLSRRKPAQPQAQ